MFLSQLFECVFECVYLCVCFYLLLTNRFEMGSIWNRNSVFENYRIKIRAVVKKCIFLLFPLFWFSANFTRRPELFVRWRYCTVWHVVFSGSNLESRRYFFQLVFFLNGPFVSVWVCVMIWTRNNRFVFCLLFGRIYFLELLPMANKSRYSIIIIVIILFE